jgi:hypothetical protein
MTLLAQDETGLPEGGYDLYRALLFALAATMAPGGTTWVYRR